MTAAEVEPLKSPHEAGLWEELLKKRKYKHNHQLTVQIDVANAAFNHARYRLSGVLWRKTLRYQIMHNLSFLWHKQKLEPDRYSTEILRMLLISIIETDKKDLKHTDLNKYIKSILW